VQDLSASEGDVVLLEYSEQQPALLGGTGMASRIITYYRAASEAELEDDIDAAAGAGGGAESEDEEGGGRRGARARVPRVDEGTVEVLGPKDRFPLLGELEPGSHVTTITNNMYTAPLWAHAPPSSDFLLVLRREAAHGAGQAKGVAAAGLDPSSGSLAVAPGPPPAAATAVHAGAARRRTVAYLRELKRVFAVGQEEPKQQVFQPASRGVRGQLAPDPDTQKFTRAFYSYQLLKHFKKVDEAFMADARKRALEAGDKAPDAVSGGGPGIMRMADVLRDFAFAGTDAQFAALVDGVADWDKGTGLLTRKQGKRPEDLRDDPSLTPERACLFESLRSGEAVLRQAGLTTLQLDDKLVEEALTKLQNMYDSMVDRLKAATAAGGGAGKGASSGAGRRAGHSDTQLWEHDGGYRRLRRTLEIAQSVYYLLQTTPWAITRK
jgi:hypothetical protein